MADACAHVDAWLWHLRGWRHDGQFHKAPAPRVADVADTDVHNAFRAALSKPKALTAVQRAHVAGRGCRVGKVRGVLVRQIERWDGLHWRWRWIDQGAGDDSNSHPLDAELRRRVVAHGIECAKVDRLFRLPMATVKAAVTNKARGAATAAMVRALAAQPEFSRKGCGMAGAIAGRLKITASQVRRHLTGK